MSKIKHPEGNSTAHIYHQPSQRNSEELKKFVFDPQEFHDAWEGFQTQGRKQELRALRRTIAFSTCLAIVSGRYYCWNPMTEEISSLRLNVNRMRRSVEKTKFIFNETTLIQNLSSENNSETSVYVVSCDTLDVVEVLHNRPERGKIGVLNFASASNPGGGWEKGAGAQEESLCRRSTLICTLSDPWGWCQRNWEYPIPDFGCIYSPDVCIFRKSFRDGFAFFPKPIHANFISIACYRSPPIKDTLHGIRINGSKIVNATLRKIRRIFEVAVFHQIDTLVLGAWGCGVYANPPSHIALLFKQVIAEYNGLIKEIYFAIPADLDMYSHHNPNGNLLPFAECFKVKILQLNDILDKIERNEEEIEVSEIEIAEN